jgi:hypothetical protein
LTLKVGDNLTLGKSRKEKAPTFLKRRQKNFSFSRGYARLFILSCPPLLTQEKHYFYQQKGYHLHLKNKKSLVFLVSGDIAK